MREPLHMEMVELESFMYPFTLSSPILKQGLIHPSLSGVLVWKLKAAYMKNITSNKNLA